MILANVSVNNLMNPIFQVLVLIGCCSSVFAADTVMQSRWADADPQLNTNPASTFWQGSQPVYIEMNAHGQVEPKYKTEVRTRWTRKNIYILFICPYEQLNLKPNPETSAETNGLWNWDVAEAFIGSDFANIKRYKEFEISPRGEWVDLDIDLDRQHDDSGWKWNSGFEVSARIDQAAHVWYGAMKIPYASVDTRPAEVGNTLRINLFRCQGASPDRKYLAWQPPMRDSFHTPEKFGTLKLVK